MNKRSRELFLAIVGMLACAACSTAPEVRELAQKTAANSSTAGSKIDAFAKGARSIATQRGELAAELSDAVELERARFDTFLGSARAAAAISGEDDEANFAVLIAELQSVADALFIRQQEVSLRRAAVRQEILSSQSALELPKKDLARISSSLGSLVENAGRMEQLVFLKSFFQGVIQSIADTGKDQEGEAQEDVDARIKDANSVIEEPLESGT